jgi:hypothetical protein
MPGANQLDANRKHRREVRLYIALPFVFGVVLLLGAVGLAAALPLRVQISAVSDFLVTILVLCPAAVCLFPLYIALVVMAFSMSGLHDNTSRWLGKTVNWSQKLYEQVDRQGERLSQRMIGLSVRIAPLEHRLFGAFDRQKAKMDDEHARDE